MSATETVICLFRVRAGSEDEFLKLLERHWPVLHRLGLVTNDPPQRFRGVEQAGQPLFVEIFTWKSPSAASSAHGHADVQAIWEAIDQLTEIRDGRPNMEFPHVQPLTWPHRV
jgi:hypothetical protein